MIKTSLDRSRDDVNLDGALGLPFLAKQNAVPKPQALGVTLLDTRVRTILNSQGGWSLEADVYVDGGWGRGSVPRAIIAGRRERELSRITALGERVGDADLGALLDAMKGQTFASQMDFDAKFEKDGALAGFGSDVALALSLAFCNAYAMARNQSLLDHLSSIVGTEPSVPNPMVNVFSGGVHGGTIPFQQLMIVPKNDSFVDDVMIALEVYGNIENQMKSKDYLTGYSSSSGMLTTITDLEQLFDILASAIEAAGASETVALGTDVAAEHLEVGNGLYQLKKEAAPITGEALAEMHRKFLHDYNFAFYEDPFGPDDETQWRALTNHMAGKTIIVGDDLFATDAQNIDPSLASGILLKMNQVGTVSGTLRAACEARKSGVRLCVSHRSKETEDTAMCDLSVAVAADLIKIGGPRRGDRISKYNQLLRLSETLR